VAEWRRLSIHRLATRFITSAGSAWGARLSLRERDRLDFEGKKNSFDLAGIRLPWNLPEAIRHAKL